MAVSLTHIHLRENPLIAMVLFHIFLLGIPILVGATTFLPPFKTSHSLTGEEVIATATTTSSRNLFQVLPQNARRRGPDWLHGHNCTERHDVVVEFARKNALMGVRAAIEHLKRAGMDRHYRNWFGPPDSSRFELVLSNFEKIRDLFPAVMFHCSCQLKGAIAITYTDDNDAPLIELCHEFWYSSQCGDTPKYSILIHEASHAFASTGDYAYNVWPSRRLARRHPAKAVANADSYAYYAEHIFKGCIIYS